MATKSKTPSAPISADLPTEKTQTTTKDWNLRPGQFVLFQNDKGFEKSDTPEERQKKEAKPDVTGNIKLPDGSIERIGLFDGRTTANKHKLTGSITTKNADDTFTKLGKIKLYAADNVAEGSTLVMTGKASLEATSATYVLTLSRYMSQAGKEYYGGFMQDDLRPNFPPVITRVPGVDIVCSWS